MEGTGRRCELRAPSVQKINLHRSALGRVAGRKEKSRTRRSLARGTTEGARGARMASHPDRAGGGEGTDEMEWNPEWDQDEEDEGVCRPVRRAHAAHAAPALTGGERAGAEDDEADEEEQMMLRDAASSQTVDPELMQGSEKFFVNLTTTSNLMTLKGSLASILSVAGNTELYGDLIRKLEQAVPEEDREDFAALMIQRNYRRISQQRKARAGGA